MDQDLIGQLTQTVDAIKLHSSVKPKLGIVLGSGLGGITSSMNIETSLDYHEIPHFKNTTVSGHQGKLLLGRLGKTEVAVLQGRIHFYEGHSMSEVVYPVRTLAMLGVERLLVTNSAGGLDTSMAPGDFMVIEDHINLMGDNPLKGPNIAQLGPRFPDMTEAYDKKLTQKLLQIIEKVGARYHRGTYAAVSGPTYETPAEVRMLKMLGGGAVGMSTVPEVIAANHLGLRVCAFSCITNLAAGFSKNKLSHQEVTDTARNVEAALAQIIRSFAEPDLQA